MKSHRDLVRSQAALALAPFLLCSTASSWADEPRVWRVANNGVDSASCGAAASPCRSIGRAVANAAGGDTIRVGPGRYGDVNADGDFDDPGDEPARVAAGVGCMLCIDKTVRVLSTDGATSTIIDAASLVADGDLPLAVFISASGVTFGERDRGFTIKNAQVTAVTGEGQDLRIAGNIALDHPGQGFTFTGSAEVAHNLSIRNAFGFAVEGDFLLTGNTAIDNVAAGFASSGAQTSLTVLGNTASGNTLGFLLNGVVVVARNNVASGNIEGFAVDSPALTFRRNTTVGNTGAGMSVGPQVTSQNGVIRENNIFGNDDSPSDVTTNCGLVNQYGMIVDATNNYWGAPTGPGPNPADAAGPNSGCDFQGSQTLVTPFSATPF